MSGAGAFGESEPVRAIALLLTALGDPQDAVALTGVLRGALFGLSDADLFAFRQAGGHISLFAEIEPADPGARRVMDALSSLRQWFAWTRMLPAAAALERVLEDSGFLALAATSPGGVDAGDLLHAVDRVRAVAEHGFTLAEAAEALAGWSGLDEEPLDESTEVDSLPLEPGRGDVVRLMNLHKVKGLEAPVVFLADPLGGYPPRVDVRVVRRGAPGVDAPAGGQDAVGYFRITDERQSGAKTLAEPVDWETHEAEERAYLEAEQDRLLYVAATRARDMLVVSRYGGKGRGKITPAWDVLTAKMADAPELVVPDHVEPPAGRDVDLSASAAASAAAAARQAHERAEEPSWTTTSVTAEVRRLPRMAVGPAEAIDEADATRAVIADTPSHRADAGMAWGTLVHGLLEHAMRHRDATRADLRRLAMWLTVEEPQLRAVIELALDTVEAVARADFWGEARAAAECHEEVPFAVRRVIGGTPRVVTGVIDLVHRDGDGWRVVDYKTDVEPDDAAQRRYAEQVRQYAAAWEAVASAPVRSTVVPARRPDGEST